MLPKAVVATASFAGLREGELRGVEWPDFAGDALAVKRSIWKTVVNEPKTRANRQRVLRHAKPHVTKDRYIKAFDPAVLEAMQRMQAVVDGLVQQWPAVGQQQN